MNSRKIVGSEKSFNAREKNRNKLQSKTVQKLRPVMHSKVIRSNRETKVIYHGTLSVIAAINFS